MHVKTSQDLLTQYNRKRTMLNIFGSIDDEHNGSGACIIAMYFIAIMHAPIALALTDN